jgi:hypothetical protein
VRRSNRETFIALRARRQGYQIASEILNPPVSLPPPEAPPTIKGATLWNKPTYTREQLDRWTERPERAFEEKCARLVLLFAGILFLIVAAVNTYMNWDWM